MNAFDWVGCHVVFTHHCNDQFFLRGAEGKEKEFLITFGIGETAWNRLVVLFLFKISGRVVCFHSHLLPACNALHSDTLDSVLFLYLIYYRNECFVSSIS